MAHRNGFVAILVAFAALGLQAQTSLSGRVGATILAPSQTISTSPFSVEQLISKGGLVSVSTNGSLATDGRPGSAQASAATLIFKGSPRETVALVLPRTVELRSAEGHVMTAQAFSSTFQNGALDRKGERRIAMGTTLQVASDQRPGTYRGHADILVAYN